MTIRDSNNEREWQRERLAKREIGNERKRVAMRESGNERESDNERECEIDT